MLTFTLQILVENQPTDADQTPQISIARLDTSAVIVPTDYPTHSTVDMVSSGVGSGEYIYSISGEIAGVTYRATFTYVIDGDTLSSTQDLTVSAASSVTPIDYFSIGSEDAAAGDAAAIAMAGSISGLTAFLAASTDDQRKARNAAAERLDASRRYQGRKYDPAQTREFPRIPFDHVPLRFPQPWQQGCIVGDRGIWDWDFANSVAIVPPAVKLAELYEANSILASPDREERLQAIADGLAEQQVGRLRESYFKQNGLPRLCLEAERIIVRYELRAGFIE